MNSKEATPNAEGSMDGSHRKRKIDTAAVPTARKNVKLSSDEGSSKNGDDDSEENGTDTNSESSESINYDDTDANLSEDIDATDESGHTALHFAAQCGNSTETKRLLESGADPNILDKYGRSVLHFASSTEVIKAALSNGKQPLLLELRDKDGNTPLQHWIQKGNVEAVKELLNNGANVHVLDKFGQTALHLASSNEMAEALLVAGADINAQDIYGRTPIHVSSKTTGLLLSTGASVITCDKTGKTALHNSSTSGVLKKLISANASANVQDELGNTPVHSAVERGDARCLRELLSHCRTDTNIRNAVGDTPLHLAVFGNCAECCKLLTLQPGTDANIKNSEGYTPLHMATTLKADVQCVEGLLQTPSIDFNAKCTSLGGNTALHIAVKNGLSDCCKKLTSQPGVDINVQNDDEDTPLHIATRGENADTVVALLSHPSVDINILNREGNRPLTYPTFPVNTYSKVIVCGPHGSQVVEAIIKLFKPKCNMKYTKHTKAGTASYRVESPKGNMVIYDMSNRTECYSSNCTNIGTISGRFPSTILMTIKHTPDMHMKNIVNEVHYWSAIMKSMTCPCHVIVVLTHNGAHRKDELDTMCQRIRTITKAATHTMSHITLVDCLLMNGDAGMHSVMTSLYSSIKESSLLVSVLGQILYAHMMEKMSSDVVALSDLKRSVETDTNIVCVAVISQIKSLLELLSEKGLIFYIEGLQDSWIIINKEKVLKNISKILAGRKEYHHSLAHNLGMVDKMSLQVIFPDYDVDMVAQILIHFEYCLVMNMPTKGPNATVQEPKRVFYFPDFVGFKRPSLASSHYSTESWSMEFPSSDKSFPNDFMVSLRFWIVDHFDLPNCNCQVWNRGIQWSDRNGITNNVEMEKTFKHISLTTTSEIKKEIINFVQKNIHTDPHPTVHEFSSTSTPVNVEVLSADLIKDVGQVIGKKWFTLGKRLFLNSAIIETIWSRHKHEGEQPQDFIDAAEEMLTRWLREGPGPKTWKRITDVLSEIGEEELAEGLRAKYYLY